MSYSSNVERAQDTISNLTGGVVSDYNDLANRVTEKQAQESQEYTNKWKEVQELGNDELAGYLGAKGLYAGYKKAKSLVGQGKDLVNQVKSKVGELADSGQDFVDEARGTVSDLASSARSQVEDLANRGRTVLTDAMEDGKGNIAHLGQESADKLSADVDDFSPENIPEGAGGRVNLAGDNKATASEEGDAYAPDQVTSESGEVAETSFGGGEPTLGNVGADVGEDAGESVGKVIGEDVLSDVADTSLLDAIPVVGEGIAVVGGLVAIGDGIAHLFKHNHTQTAPPPLPPISSFQAPQGVTAKFSTAIPSIDTATDRSGSYTNF